MKSILNDWALQSPTIGDGNDDGGAITVVNKTTNKQYKNRPMINIDGIAHPPFIRKEVLNAQRSKLSFRPTDLFVTTYAKCGTTLTEQIVCLLLNDGRSDNLNPLDKNSFDKHSDVVGKIWTEVAVVEGLGIDIDNNNYEATTTTAKRLCEMKLRMSVDEFDTIPSPRVLKTHEPVQLFPDRDERHAKVIYVTRNPFDACVSCYYHPKKGLSPHSTGVPFEGFAKYWLSDRFVFGGWIEHTKGWRREYQQHLSSCDEEKKNMIWLSYEELVDNPLDSIQRIATFIGVDTTADSALVQRVAEGCKFDNVREKAQASLDGGAEGFIDHLRSGKVGDWRNHFGPELFAEFGGAIKAELRGAGMELVYDIGDGETWAIDEEGS